MEGIISLPESLPPIDASAGPVTTNGGVTCDYISLKNALKVWIVAKFHQAVAHATSVQPTKATAVAGTGVTNCTATYRNWRNADTATSDALTAQTAAASAACANTQKNQIIVIEIDPAKEFADSYDVLGCTISDSSQGTNFVDVTYYVQTKYQQATPPSAIVD